MPETDLVRVDDRLVTAPMRAVVEAVQRAPAPRPAWWWRPARAAAASTFSQGELEEHAPAYRPLARHARGSAGDPAQRTPRLETVGEVRSLFMMWQHGDSAPRAAGGASPTSTA